MDKNMLKAKRNANKGMQKQEGGPFGAVIVDPNGQIIANGHNKVLKQHDPTAHAEIVAIRAACKKRKTHDLSGCVLYTTCEPCPMCLAAIIWANIKVIYYACTRDDAAHIGFRDSDIYEFIKGNNSLVTLKQIDRDTCLKMMNEYQQKAGKIY